MTQIEAISIVDTMKQALEALEHGLQYVVIHSANKYRMEYEQAITSLRVAIASYSQAITTEESSATQEPVAWIDEFGNAFPLGAQKGPKYLNEPMKPLYTHPPQRSEDAKQPKREWVGLTDEDFQPSVQKAMMYYGYDPKHLTLTSGAGFYKLVRAIEAKLKEKNT